jgi:hypothetical protein
VYYLLAWEGIRLAEMNEKLKCFSSVRKCLGYTSNVLVRCRMLVKEKDNSIVLVGYQTFD